MKKILLLLGSLLIFCALLFAILAWSGISAPKNILKQSAQENVQTLQQNNPYTIDGKSVTANYFGNEVVADINGDGRPDRAYIITTSPGGSGTFYYVVVTLNTTRGYINSEPYFLGDRIAPQNTEIVEAGSSTEIVVNYADRALTDSFAVPPSIGKTVRLIFNIQTLKLDEVNK